MFVVRIERIVRPRDYTTEVVQPKEYDFELGRLEPREIASTMNTGRWKSVISVKLSLVVLNYDIRKAISNALDRQFLDGYKTS